MLVAQVVVDIAAKALSEPYDYLVPVELDEDALVGAPVLVPFGGRKAVGYVVDRPGSSAIERLKSLEAVLGAPLFDTPSLELARWIEREYLCTLSDALHLVLPPGGTPAVEAVYGPAEGPPARGIAADVWREVRGRGVMTAAEIASALGPSAARAASRLAREGSLSREWRLRREHARPADDRWVRLAEPDAAVPLARSATMQRAVVDALQEGPVRVAELRAQLGSVDAALRRLVQLGTIALETRRRVRSPELAPRSAVRHKTLSAGQTDALAAIERMLDLREGTVLLDGVTGSGKTEVYLRAIETVLAAGGGSIVLVPEISLTPQTVGRFRSRFGDLVAVLHSRLSAGERFDQWDLVARGSARVVVGARSALFAPVQELRLVVIDEEHESSYKQASPPRYHARDAARELCRRRGGVLVLGSATPSLESLDAAERGEILRVTMRERVAGALLPEVTVVDMSAEFADGHRSMFSRPLLEALLRVRDEAGKAVLLLNRRGFAAFLLCRECGHVPGCELCSTSLTFHDAGSGRLVCHHCGGSRPAPAACPACGGPYLRRFGAGTQRVESELTEHVPGMPLVRMDADTTAAKGGHERALAAFEALESGVLLGTQMVAKGLDYPEVTLVGVINADTTLHLPDFRSAERTYQLLEQVAGRAGRGERPGRVIVQTYWPDHPAIAAVASHDPAPLYAAERSERLALGYPPFGRLANVLVTGEAEPTVRATAEAVARTLREHLPNDWRLLGPAPAPLARVKRAYRWHVLLKAPRSADVPGFLSERLASATEKGVRVVPDVDPADLL